jgi:mycofactocin precursor
MQTQTELDAVAVNADSVRPGVGAAHVGEDAAEGAAPLSEDEESDLVEEELLVEEISIDGMCGVY